MRRLKSGPTIWKPGASVPVPCPAVLTAGSPAGISFGESVSGVARRALCPLHFADSDHKARGSCGRKAGHLTDHGALWPHQRHRPLETAQTTTHGGQRPIVVAVAESRDTAA